MASGTSFSLSLLINAGKFFAPSSLPLLWASGMTMMMTPTNVDGKDEDRPVPLFPCSPAPLL